MACSATSCEAHVMSKTECWLPQQEVVLLPCYPIRNVGTLSSALETALRLPVCVFRPAIG